MRQVYVHGLGQTSASWEKTISQIKSGEKSLCPDLAEIIRGKEVSYHNLYKAFSDVCEEIEEPINLCGLSLGGVIALNYAIEHPKKINSLVLIATQYKMPKKMLKFQNLIFRFMPSNMFQQMGFGKADFINLCRDMMELDFSNSLHKISCPVLVIYGEKDNANKKASTELAANLKNAKIQVIKGSGHEVNMDAPKELAVLLQEFYSE